MFLRQLYLLLWKNIILRKRHFVRTTIEILWPLFLFAILVAIRQTQTITINQECHYPARAMPSAGVYPLIKSLFCNLQNPCFHMIQPSEIPGQVNSPFDKNDNSTRFLASLSSFLNLANEDSNLSKNVSDVFNLIKNNGTISDITSKVDSLTNDLSRRNDEIKSARSPLLTLLQDLPFLQKAGKQSFLTNLLGADVTSQNGYNKFCGHPSSNASVNNTNATDDKMSELVSNFTSQLNTSSTTFCEDLRSILEDKNNTKLHVLFELIKPFVLGKIPYYPDTQIVKEIISKANSTFETFALIQKLGENWQKIIGPRLYQRLENGQRVDELRKELNLDSAVPDISPDQVIALKSFFSNDDDPNDDTVTWKDIYRQLDTTIVWTTKILECSELNKFVGYKDKNTLVKHSMERVENKTLWASIVFLSPNSTDDSLPKVIKYKIRQDASSVTKTTRIEHSVWIPGAESNESAVNEQITLENPVRYFVSGFVHVQDMIETAIVLTKAEKSGSKVNDTLGAYLQEMPYPCYTKDLFLQFLPALFSLLMTLAWVYSVCIIIKNVVYEKEKRLKEVMKMMGLSNGVHWIAWFINSFLVMLCSIVLLLLFLRLGRILPYSNIFIVFIWLVCFCFATITQCFLISCFFTKANLAAACGGIIFFVLYIPYNVVYVFENQMTYPLKLVACLLSSVAFGYGAEFISEYELSGSGIQFDNWAVNYDRQKKMTFFTSMFMMLVDAVVYMTLAWYIENVFPGTYGVPKKWNFFLSWSYWTGKKRGSYDPLNCAFDSEDDAAELVKLEKEPSHLPLGVSIRKLKKVFGNGKVAVNNLSLNFYEGQITSFLGHNGAGKTTTMSMLTGLFSPTSGSATIYDHDIQLEMDQIRHLLGFCPQHNVLFGDLTVLEHLQFYSGLKSAVGGVATDRTEIDQMLKDVGLPHKRHEISRHLSGGMKRKLSVAVAFVGGSKCVILDEPTAGVDPYARRGIWDLLLRYRAGRTILLSTHHMDEADLLGDRIAIISHGQLKCCGSSLFLKSTYGVGYYLTVVKNNDVLTDGNDGAASFSASVDLNKTHSDSNKLSDEGFGSSSDLSMQPSTSYGTPIRHHTVQSAEAARHARINNLVFSIIPQAKIQEDNQREATFILPYSSQEGGKYCKLFQKLDECDATYGLTDTSLEEIFMNVAEQSSEEGEEETVKCCFCIPRKVTKKRPESETADHQARRGMRPSTRSITSTANFDNDDVSLLDGLVDDDYDDDLLQNTDSLFLTSNGPQTTASYQLKGNKLVAQQFQALFVKRFHNARRNRKSLLAQIAFPSGFVALGLLCALAAPEIKNYPPLELEPWMYGNTFTFYSNDKPSSRLSTSNSDSLLSKPSLGMRCVEDYRVLNYDGNYLTCERTSNGMWFNDTEIQGFSQFISSNQTLQCQCTTNNSRVLLADCPEGAGGSPTSRVLTQTSDSLYNMTQRNLSDWLVKTVDRFLQKRFGGLSFGDDLYTSLTAKQLAPIVQLAETNRNFTLAESDGKPISVREFAQNLARSENSKVWFDNNGFHSMPIWINVRSNAALRSVLSNSEDPTQHGIVAINHPLNFTNVGLDAAARSSAIKWTLVSVSVIFALSFIPASFILFLIDEKTTKAKHLQFVSGVNPTIYWISTLAWDMINYIAAISIIILIFFVFQTKAFVSSENFPCLVCLLFFYGFSITPMMYPASFYFEVPSTAYVVLTCINMFIGINASLITFILQGLRLPYLDEINDKLRQAFLIFPQYCLGRGLIDMAIGQSYADAISSITGIDRPVTPFDFETVGRNLLVMAIEGVSFFALTLMIQYKLFQKPFRVKNNKQVLSRAVDVDSDISLERRRVLENRRPGDILSIRNLTKVYQKRGTKTTLVAVDKLCVGVPQGECFGLLGVNGAGKTTTFKMLTGDTVPTAGDAFICGQSVLHNLREVQQNTGYCPQFEALNSLLTAREHLFFYAKLRGVPPFDIGRVADWSIRKFGLRAYADKPAGTYSGGNKRKLSAAIAFIGNPPIVFLDEPTAGMDPMSRRFLWTRIHEAVRGGRSVVLTSHSMEECEALCTRLAIMVNGKLKCIGSPQHLKNRYGEGYTVTIKVSNAKASLDSLKSLIKSSFQTSALKESHCNMLIYQLPHKDVKLSDLFVVLERAKKSLHVEDYSINQTTLDEVFVGFAKNQSDVAEDEHGFQPLNDDIVVDFSQSSDRLRERDRGTDIALCDMSSPNVDLTSSKAELLA